MMKRYFMLAEITEKKYLSRIFNSSFLLTMVELFQLSFFILFVCLFFHNCPYLFSVLINFYV